MGNGAVRWIYGMPGVRSNNGTHPTANSVALIISPIPKMLATYRSQGLRKPVWLYAEKR